MKITHAVRVANGLCSLKLANLLGLPVGPPLALQWRELWSVAALVINAPPPPHFDVIPHTLRVIKATCVKPTDDTCQRKIVAGSKRCVLRRKSNL